jgi:uncharacterized protein (TIGR02147 family)
MNILKTSKVLPIPCRKRHKGGNTMVLPLSKLRDVAKRHVITEYDDYRSYLDAVYHSVKESTSTYSYAHFSVNLGLSSTNAHAIIAGHRNLSVKTGQRISKSLGLSESHKKYLLALIKNAHAKTSEDGDAAFKEKLDLAKTSLPTKLDESRLRFFEAWHNSAILELLRLHEANDTPSWIAENIRPKLSIPKVKQSLRLLTELGYVAFDKKRGRLYPTEVSITTGDHVERLAVISFHRQMLDLAKSAMDQIPAEERDIGAVTLAVSQKLREQFTREFIDLRKRFLILAESETDPDEIIQINLQLFPLSRRQKK